MKTIITKQFEKDVDRHLNKSLQKELANVLMRIQVAHSLNEITNLKKLRNHRSAFRIKFGDLQDWIYT